MSDAQAVHRELNMALSALRDAYSAVYPVLQHSQIESILLDIMTVTHIYDMSPRVPRRVVGDECLSDVVENEPLRPADYLSRESFRSDRGKEQ